MHRSEEIHFVVYLLIASDKKVKSKRILIKICNRSKVLFNLLEEHERVFYHWKALRRSTKVYLITVHKMQSRNNVKNGESFDFNNIRAKSFS